MDWLRDIKLPAALVLASLILGAFGTVGVLVVLGHQSLAAISTFLTGLAVAYGAVRLSTQGKSMERVERLANGNLARRDEENGRLKDQMTQMAQEHARTVAQLSAQLPAGSPLPSALSDEPR